MSYGEIVCIPWGGNPIVQYYKGKFITSDNRIATSIDVNKLDNKFLYYVLINKLDLISSFYRGAGIKHPDMSKVLDIIIPLPPIEVQKEIVRILDTFTKYQDLLNRELELRKKQYEYYRDKLLTFAEGTQPCGDKVEYKTLSEIGSFYAGLNGKNKDDFKDGNAKYITYMNVFSNLSVNTNINDTVKIGEKEKQNIVKYGDIIFTGSSETIEECGMSSVVTNELNEKLYLNSFCFGFRFNEPEIMLPDFSKYLFRSTELRKKIIKTANGVTRFNVSKKKMEKILIPIPPSEEQERIVNILDKFDALCNDITKGLPAEIEMRKKQYEYYRDKLLTFKEKKK